MEDDFKFETIMMMKQKRRVIGKAEAEAKEAWRVAKAKAKAVASWTI